jgi:tetratricopeptide (TPR) repeat protein
VFQIQEEIATQILNQLRATLLDEEVDAFEPQATNPEVYDRYLLARQRLYNRSRQSIENAVEILDEAIALDPGYAPALAQRGIATLFLSDRSYGAIPEAEAQRQGKRFIDQALEIDPQLAEAWAGLGLYHSNRQSEHEAAIDALTKALDLNPNLIDASNWLYVTLNGIGENIAARDLIEHMIDKDPLYKPAFGNGVQTFNNFGMREQAEAIIARFRSFDPNEPIGIYSEALHHFYYGEVAAGFPLAQRGIELAPTSSVARFTWSVALIESLQIERLAEEGNEYFRIDALDAIGRRDEAFELAYTLEQDGYIEELFRLLNRAGRSRDITDYVEERWPTLDAFAADYPKDGSGYPIMTEIAHAYSRQGKRQEFDAAMSLIEAAISELRAQGVDQFPHMREVAKFHALAGQPDQAIDWLQQAVNRGMRMYAPLAVAMPSLESLANDPNFIEVEATMIAKINEERSTLGLDPIDPYATFWR